MRPSRSRRTYLAASAAADQRRLGFQPGAERERLPVRQFQLERLLPAAGLRLLRLLLLPAVTPHDASYLLNVNVLRLRARSIAVTLIRSFSASARRSLAASTLR